MTGSPFMFDRQDLASNSDNSTSTEDIAKYQESMEANNLKEIETHDEPLVEHVIEEKVNSALRAIGLLDTRTTVNAQPFYIGPWMILSDQDMTALKHHILSSAVMGTAFAGLIAWVSSPSVPFYVKALVLGGVLTGAQAILVALGNVCILAWEYCWPRRSSIGHALAKAAWWAVEQNAKAHTFHLDNGATVYADQFYAVVVNDGCEAQ